MCWVSYTCKNLTQVHGNFTNLCVTVSTTWSTLNKWEWICDTHIYIIYISVHHIIISTYILTGFAGESPEVDGGANFVGVNHGIVHQTLKHFLHRLTRDSFLLWRHPLQVFQLEEVFLQVHKPSSELQACHKVTESVRMKCIWTIFNITLKHSEQWNSDVSLVILLLVSHLKEIQTHNRFK